VAYAYTEEGICFSLSEWSTPCGYAIFGGDQEKIRKRERGAKNIAKRSG